MDQLLPGSGAQHVLKDTDGLAALCMGREPEAGVDASSLGKKLIQGSMRLGAGL